MTNIEALSLNVSPRKGTAKTPVGEVVVDRRGIVGDAHAGAWHRQVSLLEQGCVDEFALRLGRPLGPGEFGENITYRGVAPRTVAPLDRFVFGEVELEVTQIGKSCHGAGCSIFTEVGTCVMPTEGLFARVLRGGVLRTGAAGVFHPRPLRCRIITLSDRAAAGDYDDRSGPRVRQRLEDFFAGRRWHAVIEQALIPDEPALLAARIRDALAGGADLILTTGSTGVGPRDIAPDTVAPLCDRLIPGIMEHLRAKFGATRPQARLSRAIAGVAGTAQIYTLPGSVRAVDEYLPEIFATLEHVLLMLHGVDAHG